MKGPMSTPESTSTRQSSQSLLLQHAFSQFVNCAEKKIELVLVSTGVDSDLYNELLIVLDKDFTATMALLGTMAKYDLKCIIDSLMAWRKSKNELQEKNSNYERRLLLFNYILVLILQNILKNLTIETLPEQLGAKIEEMVFGQLNSTNPDIIQRNSNRHSNMESFATLAGSLSELRFPTVSSRFLIEINKNSTVKESKAELLIRCMRYLKLKIYPLEKLEETVHFLKVCGESFLESHSLKLKHAFAMTFLDLLEPIAAVASAEVNLPTWMKTIELIFPKAQKMIGKPRHFQNAMALITTLLCVSKRDFFSKNWLGFCDLFVQKFKDRDKPIKHLALASVSRLVWVYLFRCMDSITTNAIKKMDSILKIMFPFGRRIFYSSDLDLEMYIRLVYYICNKFPDFSAECIFPLLFGYSTQQHSLATASLMSPEELASSTTSFSPIYSASAGLQSSSSISLVSNSSVNDPVPLERYSIGIGAFNYFIIDVLVSIESLVSSSTPESAPRKLAISTTVIVESKYTLPVPQFPQFTDISKYELCEIQRSDIAAAIPPIITTPFLQKMNGTTKDTLEKFNDVMGLVGGILETYFRKLPILELINHASNPSTSSPHANGNYGGGTITSLASLASNRSSMAEQSSSSLSLIEFRSSADRNYMHDIWKIWIDAIPIASPSSMSPKSVISFVTLALFSGHKSLHEAALLCLERMSNIKSTQSSLFWSLEGISWREYVVYNFLDSAYRCLIENMTDVLGFQWKKFELSIVNSINRLLDPWFDEIMHHKVENSDEIIDQLEGCTLIFLCSINPEVRFSAMELLKKIRLLLPPPRMESIESSNVDDKVRPNGYLPSLKRPLKEYQGLAPHKSRISDILKQIGRDLIRRNYADPAFSGRTSFMTKEEDSKEKEYRKSLFQDPDSLLHLAGSSSLRDAQIWSRCFPDLTRALYDYGHIQPLALAFKQLMSGIHILSPTILQSSELGSKISSGTIKWPSEKSDKRLTIISEELIEQWSFYCVFAVSVSGIVTEKDLQLLIRGSVPSELAIETLFNSLLDFMGAERAFIRQVAVQALCGVHSCNYGLFLDLLEPHMTVCAAIIKNIPNNRKSGNSTLLASQKRSDRHRQDLVYILSFIADFIDFKEFRSGSTFLSSLLPFIKQIARFLSIPEIQNEWDHQLLRSYFCALVGRFYSHLVAAIYNSEGRAVVEEIFSFELRMGLFRLLETWCGYGELSKQTRDREAYLMNQVLEQVKDITERASLTSMMEDQRMMLEVASLKAMCALSFGPLSHAFISTNKFDLSTIITWIKSVFSAPDAKIHHIAHLSLDRILSSNAEDEELWNLVVNECYNDPEDKTSIGFFLVLADLLCQDKKNPCSLARICTLTLYKIGKPDISVRNAAARVFARLDQSFAGISNSLEISCDIPPILDDYGSPWPEQDESRSYSQTGKQDVHELTPDIHLISRPIAAVFKAAQREISSKWSDQRKDISLSILSEIFMRLDLMDNVKRSNDVKDMLMVLAPWISNINLESFEMIFLQKSKRSFESFRPPASPEANLSLTILFCLTVQYSLDFLSEMETVWLMLFEFEDEYILRTRMEIIIEFLIQVALLKKNPKAILNGKTIFIYLAQMNAFEILMERITSEGMIPYIPDKDSVEESFASNMMMIDSLLLDTSNQSSFSRTQIAIMFISDMILQIAPSTIIPRLSTILHVCLVHIDHFSSLISDDCTSLLNGTIQALVLDLHEPIISLKAKSMIKYEDLSSPNFDELESVKVIKSIVDTLTTVFSGLKPGFRNEWADVAFKWGINCPIRHIACRSLQIYRCISSKISKNDAGKLILRISTILGDEVPDVQGYAMECLKTLIYMLNSAESLENYLEIWWAGIACLYSPHLWEYSKGIKIMYIFPDRLSFNSQSVLDMLESSKPKSNGIDTLLEKMFMGLYHDELAFKTLYVFNILAPLPKSVEFLGDVSHRLLCGILANVTQMMKSFESPSECKQVFEVSARLCQLSTSLEYDQLSDLLFSFSKQKFRNKNDFIFQLWSVISDIFQHDIKFIVSVILRLTSRKETLETVLQVLIGLIRVLGPLKFSSLSRSSSFWSPLIDLIQTNPSSPGLTAVLDLSLSMSSTSETDLKMLFGKSKSSKSIKNHHVDSRQVRQNFQNVSRNVNSSVSSTFARNERLKKELKAVSMALEEELEFDLGTI